MDISSFYITDETLSTIIVPVLFLVFVGMFLSVRDMIRTRHMRTFAQLLHCRFRQYDQERSVFQRMFRILPNTLNIIDGQWRGKHILIHDVRRARGSPRGRASIVRSTMINGEEHKAFFTLTGYVSVKKIQAILQEQQKRPDYGGKQGATPTSPPMSIMEALEKGYAQAPSPQEAMQMNVPRLFIIGFILFLLIIIGAVLFEEFFGL